MYIGVDIGGTKILVVAGHNGREIMRSQKITTPDDVHQGMIEITHLIEQVAGSDKIKAIGIGAAGAIDRQKGILLKNPNMSWEPAHLTRTLKNHFKVPVGLENDADAAGLAEATIGAGSGKPYVLYMTISTGVGIGMVIDGEIYHGAHDPEGGHIIIHAEGKLEELETAISGRALKRRFGLYGYEITEPAMWDEFAADLAIGIHNFVMTLSPSVIVIGGGVGVHFHKFSHFLPKHLADLHPLYPTPPIVQATYIETAVAHGALIIAEQLKS